MFLVSSSTCDCYCVQAPGPNTASLPRAELQQHYPVQVSYFLTLGGQGGPVLPRGAPLRAPRSRGWGAAQTGLLSHRCRSLGLGREDASRGHGRPEAPEACCKALPLFQEPNHTCAIGAASATMSTKVFPTATVSSQPACSTDFMLAGD